MNKDEFWKILHDIPAVSPLFYRLYYDADGYPLYFSMEDLPGNYIEIDQETYARNNSRVRVVDGKIQEHVQHNVYKLVPSNTGFACYPSNVAIVVSAEQPNTKWSKRAYQSS